MRPCRLQERRADSNFSRECVCRVSGSVLRIRNVYLAGSEFFSNPDPGSKFKKITETRIRIRVKEFKSFNPKIVSKLSENKIRDVHLGSGSWIRILTFYPSWMPDPGVKKVPDPGSGSATPIAISRILRRISCVEI